MTRDKTSKTVDPANPLQILHEVYRNITVMRPRDIVSGSRQQEIFEEGYLAAVEVLCGIWKDHIDLVEYFSSVKIPQDCTKI